MQHSHKVIGALLESYNLKSTCEDLSTEDIARYVELLCYKHSVAQQIAVLSVGDLDLLPLEVKAWVEGHVGGAAPQEAAPVAEPTETTDSVEPLDEQVAEQAADTETEDAGVVDQELSDDQPEIFEKNEEVSNDGDNVEEAV